MPRVTFADHKARGDVESCKQRGCAVPDIGVGPPFGYACHHRQDWLFPVKRLDLALLIDT